MEHKSAYTSKKPDENGLIPYTEAENAMWQQLITRQLPIVAEYAVDEYLEGLQILNFPQDRVPQLTEVSAALTRATGWSVCRVPALISYERFFALLAKREFPAATFIRRPDEIEYLKEPDIFHEFFGHCPLITHPAYADFMQKYGELALDKTAEEQELLARLYWFTVEFGLMHTKKGLRCYGGGILSSPKETPYSIDSDIPARKPLTVLDVLRTPYRIDILQTVYFCINDFQELCDLAKRDLMHEIKRAQELGEFEPTFSLQ
jgi:phenylalanine-4-hydroxylase